LGLRRSDMANPWRGEVALVLDGQRHVARLTLGALAELEETMLSDTLVDLVARFDTGDYSSRDVLAIVVAGLRGGGWNGQALDLMSVDIEGGPIAAAKAAARLLASAFALPEAS